jgi:hypothetical protein
MHQSTYQQWPGDPLEYIARSSSQSIHSCAPGSALRSKESIEAPWSVPHPTWQHQRKVELMQHALKDETSRLLWCRLLWCSSQKDAIQFPEPNLLRAQAMLINIPDDTRATHASFAVIAITISLVLIG